MHSCMTRWGIEAFNTQGVVGTHHMWMVCSWGEIQECCQDGACWWPHQYQHFNFPSGWSIHNTHACLWSLVSISIIGDFFWTWGKFIQFFLTFNLLAITGNGFVDVYDSTAHVAGSWYSELKCVHLWMWNGLLSSDMYNMQPETWCLHSLCSQELPNLISYHVWIQSWLSHGGMTNIHWLEFWKLLLCL